MKTLKNNLYLIKFIIRYGKMYLFLIPLSAVFQAIFMVAGILGIKYIIDAISAGKSLEEIIFIIIIYALIILITNLFFTFTNYLFPLISKKISIGITKERMDAAKKLDFRCFDDPEYYDKYTRALSSGESQTSLLIGSMIAVFSNVVTLISVISVLATFDIIFIFIAVIDVVISFIVMSKQNKLKYNYDYENTKFYREETYFKGLCLNPSVQKESKVFYRMLDFFKAKYNDVSKILYNREKKFNKKYNLPSFLENTSTFVTSILSMSFAAFKIVSGNLSIGSFVSTINGIETLTGQIFSFGSQVPKLIQNARYVDNFRTIMEYEPEIEMDNQGIELKDEGWHEIEFDNVCFAYPNTTKNILNNLSFKINKGESIAIVGENGAGKTTMIKLLLRLYDPQQGEIRIDKINIKEYNINSLRKVFSAVFQDYNIYSVSIKENITLMNSEIDPVKNEESVFEVLDKVGMKDKIINFQNKENSQVTRYFDENGVVFSGGEQQRICIARALSKKSSIVVLDEPSSALDPIVENNIINMMQDIEKEKMLVIISHRLSVCKIVNKILYMENGYVVEEGSHNELMKKQGKYAELFNIQAEKYN